nr:hypothetical protein [Clostridium sp.]
MKSRMKKTLIVFMFLCLAAVSVSRIAIRAYAAGSGNLRAIIYGTSEVVTYDGQEHEMPFSISYQVDDEHYPGRVDGSIELKKEYRKVDAGTYRLSLQSNYFDSYIATSSDYTFDDDSLIAIFEQSSILTINPVPLIITAKDWVCVYNGELQGPGDTAYNDPAEISGLAEAVGLQGNDSITFIELDGQGQEVGTYPLEITGYSINGVGKADIKNYSPITVVGGRLKIGYQVKITPGAHMTKTGTSGELTQISVNE